MDSLSAEEGADRTLESDLKDLSHEDPFIREQAGVRVAKRGFGIVQALISILNDFAKPGLSGVAQSLGQIGDRRAIPALAQAAKMGDEELRLAATCALAQFREPEVLPILLMEVERPHAVIQGYLAHMLGTYQDARVIPVLSKLCVHPNREVAFQAACALGETGDRSGIHALQQAWRRSDPLVRAACAASLRRLGGKPSLLSIKAICMAVIFLAVAGAGIAWIVYR